MLTFVLVVATVVCAWYVFHLLLGLLCLAWLGTGIALSALGDALDSLGVHLERLLGPLHLEYALPIVLGVGPFLLLAVALLR